MDPLFIVIPAVGVVCFASGILFSKVVLAEAVSIKQHVTDEVAKVRSDISSLLGKAAAKL
jgi:hypothetical protein